MATKQEKLDAKKKLILLVKKYKKEFYSELAEARSDGVFTANEVAKLDQIEDMLQRVQEKLTGAGYKFGDKGNMTKTLRGAPVSFRVSDEATGQPVAGATITAGPGKLTTDARGAAEAYLKVGAETAYTIEAAGYAVFNGTVAPKDDAGEQVQVGLESAGEQVATTFVITDGPAGFPLPGATVRVGDQQATTDDRGQAVVTMTTGQDVVLEVTAKAYKKLGKRVRAQAGVLANGRGEFALERSAKIAGPEKVRDDAMWLYTLGYGEQFAEVCNRPEYKAKGLTPQAILQLPINAEAAKTGLAGLGPGDKVYLPNPKLQIAEIKYGKRTFYVRADSLSDLRKRYYGMIRQLVDGTMGQEVRALDARYKEMEKFGENGVVAMAVGWISEVVHWHDLDPAMKKRAGDAYKGLVKLIESEPDDFSKVQSMMTATDGLIGQYHENVYEYIDNLVGTSTAARNKTAFVHDGSKVAAFVVGMAIAGPPILAAGAAATGFWATVGAVTLAASSAASAVYGYIELTDAVSTELGKYAAGVESDLGQVGWNLVKEGLSVLLDKVLAGKLPPSVKTYFGKLGKKVASQLKGKIDTKAVTKLLGQKIDPDEFLKSAGKLWDKMVADGAISKETKEKVLKYFGNEFDSQVKAYVKDEILAKADEVVADALVNDKTHREAVVAATQETLKNSGPSEKEASFLDKAAQATVDKIKDEAIEALCSGKIDRVIEQQKTGFIDYMIRMAERKAKSGKK